MTRPDHDVAGQHDAIADVTLLGQTWAMWAQVCQELDARTWTSPSGIGEWSVRELVAHVVSRGPVMVSGMLDAGSDTKPEIADSSQYFRTVSARPAAAAGVAERAVEYAGAVTDAQLVAALTEVDEAYLARVREHLEDTVESPAGSVRLADYLQTRILEAVVHGLDLLRATRRPVALVPEAAARRAAAVLIDLVPTVELLDVATGRRSENPFPVLT